MHSANLTASGPTRASFLQARLASFLAVAPLGVWTFFHLWNNLAAFYGPAAWEASVTGYSSPFAQAFTGCLVLVPLAIHTVWGIGRLFTSKPNNPRYRAYANLKYLVQRIAGVGVLFFLGAHLWLAMIHPRLTTGHGEAFADIAHEMRFNPPTLVVYILGTLGVTYHLANGLQTVAMGWGIVTSKAALKRLEWMSIGFFVLLLAMAWSVVFALWTAGGNAGASLPVAG
jgi:succinate dehydrogenase / fumarate reductase cytochrome b subunit